VTLQAKATLHYPQHVGLLELSLSIHNPMQIRITDKSVPFTTSSQHIRNSAPCEETDTIPYPCRDRY